MAITGQQPKSAPSKARAKPVSARAALNPVARETIHGQVYRELRKALIYGLFTPGQVLTIQDLAASLNTSTMPVRDALARLISEQALEAMANRSVRVPLIDAAHLADLKRARLVIETAAMELAAQRLGKADFEALRSPIRDYSAAMSQRGRSPIEGELEANRAFHFRLYEASGSVVLMPIIESLWLQSGPVIRAAVMAFDPDSKISAPHYHEDIVAALEAGDLVAARSALADDIGRAFDIVAATLQKGEVYERG